MDHARQTLGHREGEREGSYSHLCARACSLHGNLIDAAPSLEDPLTEGEIGDLLEGHGLLGGLTAEEARVKTERGDAAVRIVGVLEVVVTEEENKQQQSRSNEKPKKEEQEGKEDKKEDKTRRREGTKGQGSIQKGGKKGKNSWFFVSTVIWIHSHH